MPSGRWHLIRFGGTCCVQRLSGGSINTGITAYKTAEAYTQADYILYIQRNENLKFNHENMLTYPTFTNLTSRVPKARSNEDFFIFSLSAEGQPFYARVVAVFMFVDIQRTRPRVEFRPTCPLLCTDASWITISTRNLCHIYRHL